MSLYWDSSALVQTISDEKLEARLVKERGVTRVHTLTEVFSALTGKLHLRVTANEAAKVLRTMAGHLQFIHLSENEILGALENAQRRGVRGGRVHDYLHALAAEKAKAHTLLTTDENDFDNLVSGLTVEQV